MSEKNYTLTNFSITCSCGKEYGLKFLNDIKKCSCGGEVKIQDSLKKILIDNGTAKKLKTR